MIRSHPSPALRGGNRHERGTATPHPRVSVHRHSLATEPVSRSSSDNLFLHAAEAPQLVSPSFPAFPMSRFTQPCFITDYIGHNQDTRLGQFEQAYFCSH